MKNGKLLSFVLDKILQKHLPDNSLTNIKIRVVKATWWILFLLKMTCFKSLLFPIVCIFSLETKYVFILIQLL